MLITSKKLFLLLFSVVAFEHYSLAMEGDNGPLTRTEHNKAVPLRQLDLTGYENLNSTKLTETKGGIYGFQNPHYGVLEQKIFSDVQSFSLMQEKPWVYLEVGAAYGLFPLRVYEHTHKPEYARFIVNDLIRDQLSSLLTLMFTPNEKNKGLSSSFKIFPGDCLTVFEISGFKDNTPNGIDFISCLNCIHFFSPNKLLIFFAKVSEMLKQEGRFYLMHDSGKIDTDAVKFIESLSITKEAYNSLSESERKRVDQQLGSLFTSPKAKLGGIHAKISFIINKLKERNFHYPTFINKEIMEKFTKVGADLFYPSSDFIKEIAKVVGLNLIETGARVVMEGGIPQEVEANSEEANSLWYIFEKDSTSSLGRSGEESFRNSEGFKQILRETERADEERKRKGETINPADQKKAEGLYNRARGWFDKGKQAQGIQCLKEAATLGYANAQCDLGVMYFKGTGIQKNEEEGVKWFKKAADQNFDMGQFNYGFAMLKKGNKEIAYEYLKKAAEQGYADAKHILGGGRFAIA